MTDYRAPAFEISVDGSPILDDVARQVASVTVTTEPDSIDRFRIAFANPFPELPWTHDASVGATFSEGKAVKIKVGYADDLHDAIDGEVTSLAASFPDDGVPAFVVEGHSKLHRLRGSAKTRTFQDMTDAQIAQQVIQDASLQAQADDTQTVHPYVMQYNQTDLAFLLERARRIRYELVVEDGTVKFRAGGETGQQRYTLVWGNLQDAVGADAFPLRAFNATINALQPLDEVFVRGLHPTTREPIEGHAGSGDAETTGGGRTGPAVAAAAFGARTSALVAQPVASQQEADQLARAVYNRRALEFVSGSGTSVGIPVLRAGAVVDLSGVGSFNGTYYVTHAEHTIGTDGYTTAFRVRSDSLA